MKIFPSFQLITKNIKLRTKFLLSHLLFVLIPMFLFAWFLFTQISDVLVSNTIRTEESLIDQMETSVSAVTSKISAIPKNILEQDFFSNTLQSIRYQEYRNTPDYYSDAVSFFSYIYSLKGSNRVEDIKIYVNDSRSEILEDYPDSRIFLPVSDIQGSYWHGIFNSKNIASLFCPTFYLSTNEVAQYGELAYIQRVNYGKSSCYIAIYFSTSMLSSILQENIRTEDTVAYLINSRQSFITYSDASLAGLYHMRYDEIPDIIPTQKEFVARTLVGQKMYVGYRSIPGTDWYLVSVVPSHQIYSDQYQLVRQFLIFSVFLLIISCIMPIITTNSITRRISTIIEQMNSVRHEPPKKLPKTEDRDEIGDLITTYNYMIDELDGLMQQQKRSAEELRIAEYRALQAQINPHFLYNMLDMINWLSKSGKSDKVSVAVQALSKFYKLTLSKKEVTTTVSEELDHVSLYVKLQNMRFENKIDFLIDVPDEILPCEIPKLVLQPVVENSILHGILGKESKAGTIVIMAWLEGSDIVFVVSDDGTGIPPEQLEQILSGKGESVSGSNIGVYNTHRRLQLYYDNQEFGLTYRSTLGEGTEVEIRIPMVLSESASE